MTIDSGYMTDIVVTFTVSFCSDLGFVPCTSQGKQSL